MPQGWGRATVVPVNESKATPKPVFMVECYAAASGADASAAVVDRVRAACADLRTAEADVAYLGALVVPDDELAFHVFTATNADDVLEVSRRAGLRVERVMESVAIGFGKASPARRQALPVGDESERPVAHAPGEIGP